MINILAEECEWGHTDEPEGRTSLGPDVTILIRNLVVEDIMPKCR